MKAFLRKEWMEWSRTGRLLILALVFTVFGIMNPALAKMTPWLMETLSDSLVDTGITTAEVTVTAMMSWSQFYKNFPIGLMIFVLMCSGSFTAEYEKGTLIPVVTKGLSRKRILAAKAVFLYGMWTALYFLCFGITYVYNAYFWDNGITGNLFFAAACTWLYGMWVIAFLVCFSVLGSGASQVLLGTGGIAMICFILGRFPKINAFLPGKLMEGMELLTKAVGREEYYAGAAVAFGMILLCMGAAAGCFDKKQL